MAWFLCPYKRDTAPLGFPSLVRRYCAMRDFNAQILADGGAWDATEVLGNQAVVKVQASPATLSTINAEPGFTRIPLDLLDDTLGSLTAGQRNAIRQVILDAGYTPAEVTARFPNLANSTVGEALRFLASRRKKPRYDQPTDSIVLDGPDQACRSVDEINGRVP
jgi:hypothetical protein